MRRKRNLTLALDEDLIIRARIAAVKRQTSLTDLIRRTFQELVTGDQERAQALNRLRSRMRKPSMQVGRARWTRDEIHERP
jgi:hypothetical protein